MQVILSLIECDKNLGVAFIDIDVYERIALDHLVNGNSYVALDQDPLDDCVNEINKSLVSLYNTKHISKFLLNKIFIQGKCNLGCFRFFAKVHKFINHKLFWSANRKFVYFNRFII